MNAVLYAFIVGLHILICFILIVVVLLQTGKGADAGALMGGSSQTVFGSRGPTTFFHYLTGGAASLFLVTSLFLSCSSGPTRDSDSVIGDAPDAASAEAAHDPNHPGHTEDEDTLVPAATPADAVATPAGAAATPAL